MTAADRVAAPVPPGTGAEREAPEQPRTTIPPRPQRRGTPPEPRALAMIRAADVLAVVGALAAAVCTTTLLFTQIGSFSGVVGYIVVTWCLFVLYYAVLVSMDESRPAVADRVAAVVVTSLGAVVLLALLFVIYYTFAGGWKALVHLNFYTQDLRSTTPTDPLTKGGVQHAVVGTLIEVGIAMAIAVPFGLLAAVFMNEVPGPFARFVRTVVNAMTALPDVLAGLFIYATLILAFGLDTSGLAAGCALAITALPITCRAADVVLRLMPGGLTEASYALGSGQWRTVRYVTLPTVRSGLATAVILGAARAIGETAPVLLTAGATGYLNTNPVRGPMMSLPLMAFLEVLQPFSQAQARGFGAAAALLLLVLALFAIARMLGGRGPGQLTARQQRRRAARSRRDLARFTRRARAAQAVTGAVLAAGPGLPGQARGPYRYRWAPRPGSSDTRATWS
jgi:phosphate transport system permease protein